MALLHAVGNVSAAALPYWVSDVGRLVQFGLLAAVVLVIIVAWGPKTLARESPRHPLEAGVHERQKRERGVVW